MIGVKQDILFSLKQQLIKVIQLINKTNQWYIPYKCWCFTWEHGIKHIKIISLTCSPDM